MIEINPGILAVEVVTFLLALGILWKVSWGPLTKLLVERREKIQKDLEAAEGAKRQMEELKISYEKRLAEIETKTQEFLSRAREEGEAAGGKIVQKAQEEARRTLEKARQELLEEGRKAVVSVRSEVARLSIAAAEKILRHSIDRKVQDEFLEDALKDLDKHSKELH